MARRARVALRFPARIISSSRVFRELTSANSVATKKALASTSSTTVTRPITTEVPDVVPSISSKCSRRKVLLRGDGAMTAAAGRLIRRVAVPPLDALRPFLPHAAAPDDGLRSAVAGILAGVRARGDAAVRELTLRHDGVDLAPAEWEVTLDRCQEALERIPAVLREALVTAADRVRSYHEHQRERGFRLTTEDGSEIGMKVTPLDRVGLYVPGGKASYPSSVVMNAVPALVAGVREIVAVVPPGGVTDTVLAACALSGVTRVFRIGGAQAVAALAFGTATVPRVDKIVGPGNRWVAEAKRQVVGQVGIDMIAGPTELVVLADYTARPAWVAADLIAQ